MGETVRFGVSLDEDLLAKFDALCRQRKAPSRSEALRDVIRDALVRDSLQSDHAEAAGVLTLIYVHLDHHHCLETLVLRGRAGQLRALADQLRAIRGVTHATFSITAVGADLP